MQLLDEKQAGISRWFLAGILLVFVILSIVYTWFVPPFEGPDEPEHFAYVTWLSEGKGLPPQGEEAWSTPLRQEASQPPLYYWLSSLPVRVVNLKNPPALVRTNPNFPSNAPGTLADNKNYAVHYPNDTSPLRGGWLALYLSRGITFLFGILLVICVFGLSRQVVPESQELALTSAFLAAVIPQVLFMSNLVSNDIAAAATGALTLWLLAVLVRQGPSGWRGLALGLAFGLAALSKINSLALAVPIAAGLAWLWWTRYYTFTRLFQATLAIAAGALIVAGWWFVRTWNLYGTPLGLSTHYQAPWALNPGSVGINTLPAWTEIFFSFWAAFGWGNIKFPGWTYAIIGGFVIMAGIGLLLAARHWWSNPKRSQIKPVLLSLLLLAVISVAISLQVWMKQVTAPHGRLMYPALAAIVVLLNVGWRMISKWIVIAGVSATLLLAILSPILLIRQAYALPRFLTAQQMADRAGASAIGWRFDHIAELFSVTLDKDSALEGEVIKVETCWVTINSTEQDLDILVHIVGPENRVVAGRHTYPGLGSYPTSIWQPEKRFCDAIHLDIPEDLDQTLLYKVEVGLVDNKTDERLPAYSSDGALLSHTFAQEVRLEAIKTIELAQNPEGQGAIRLVDAQFDPIWTRNDTNDLNLRWWVADKLDRDYSVFVHVRDPATGRIVAQGDGPPAGGWYPTSVWRIGEVIDDLHTVSIPPGLEGSEYELVVGWYDLESGIRLGEEYHIDTIEVAQ